MPIQEETAQPVHPLGTLEGDYAHAVLHLAWDMHKRTRERTLLCGIVEFLPTEVPPPVDDGDQSFQLPKSEHRAYVRHAVVPAARALDWYLDCRRGEAVLPEDDGTLPAPGDERARRLRLLDLGEEPPWPSLTLATEPEQLVPFCPKWHGQPRVHQLIPLTDLDLAGLWPREKERREAVEFLTERLHFDLMDYPEYWGSVHLVAPNPVFRETESRRLPTSTEQVDQLLFRLHPRAGQTLAGLELAINEIRASGECSTARISVMSPLIQVTFGHRSRRFQETIRDQRRGLLDTQHTGIFEGFHGTLEVGDNRRRAVQVPGTTRRPADPYEVALRRREGSSLWISSTPEQRVPGAGSRISDACRVRKAQDAARQLRERWFDGEVQEATDVLRSLLDAAKREVFIVDAYFAASELYRFALAVGQVDVPISILTSAEVLKKEDPSSISIEKGDVLGSRLQHLASQKDVNLIRVRVMPGDRPAIHDRFLLVDDRIWLLGTSLTEIASRGTMIVALSYPELVRDKLRQAWNGAEELSEWLQKRQAVGATKPGVSRS